MASSPLKKIASVLLVLAFLVQPCPPPASATGGLATADLASGLTVIDLANALLGADSGITIDYDTVSYTGADSAAGTFVGGEGIVGFGSGIILSSGAVASVAGPNSDDGVTTDHALPGDADLNDVAGSTTLDAAFLEFDFVPEGERVAFIYVFSSDEYNEYANSEYNDTFAFLVNGTNYARITTVGGEVVPVTINTINGGNPTAAEPENQAPRNPEYFRDNEMVEGVSVLNTEMDGLTTVLTLQAPVNPNVPNHVKIAIADVFDGGWDSNVFIKQHSFTDRAADLSLEMTTSTYQPEAGTDVTFAITLGNAGPYAADTVRVKAALPAGLSFVSATPEQGTYDAGSGLWDVGALAVDGSASLEIVATATTTDPTTFTTQIVESNRLDPDSTPNNGVAGEDDQKTVRLNHANHAPTAVALSAAEVSEDAAAGALVGYLTATDADTGDTHVFALVDDAGGRFVIDNNQLKVGGADLIDYEADETHTITIRATDSGNLSFDQDLSIEVLDVEEPNSAPIDISLASASLPENAAPNTTAGTLSTTDPDPGDTHTYSLVSGTGADGNTAFNVSGNSLRATSALNHETQSEYSVRIRTTDAGGLYYEEAFTITVTDVDEAPVNISLSSASIAENQAPGTTVGTLSASDDDAGDTHTYALVSGTGDSDNGSFSISGSTLSAETPFDYEAKSSYTIRVRATDSTDLSYEKQLTITVADVNEAPTDLALSSIEVAENEASGTVVGTLSTTDEDGGTHTYTLVSGTGDADNASFAIDEGSLVTTAAFDREAKSSYALRIRSTDSGGLNVEKAFTVTVTDVNDAPTDISMDSPFVAEGEPSDTLVGTFSSSDQDVGDTHTYALVSGEGDDDTVSFTISGDALLTAATFDYNTRNSYSIRVRATDSGDLAYEKAFTIGVTDVGDAPTDIGLSGASVAENLASGTVVGTLSASDPDVGDSHTYALVSGTGDADNASFTIDGDAVVTAASFDHEAKSSYTIRVRATDSADLYVERQFAITVTDADEAPTDISLSSASVAENGAPGATVGMLSASDDDAGDSHTYALVSGEGDDDNAAFAISDDALLTADAFDHEVRGSYTIRVRATDSTDLLYEKQFTITVIDVNEAPTDVGLSAATITENEPSGVAVGVLEATDPDAGDTHTYTLVNGAGDGDNAAFAIDGSTLVTARSFDHEAKSSYTIRVRATDGAGLYVERAFTIAVADADEGPTDISLSSSSVTENQAAGTTVGTLSATDDDAGDTHSFALVSGAGDGDNAYFIIDGGTLQAAASFDYEVRPSLSIRVRATDSTGLYTEEQFTIMVIDANEAPTAVDDAAATPRDAPVQVNVVANDSDVDGDPLEVTAYAQPLRGTVSAVSPGILRYAPEGGFVGQDGFTYTVSDGEFSATARVSVTVSLPPHADHPGDVHGVVFEDVDGDGRPGADEERLARVAIRLVALGADRLLGTADDVPVASTATAADGSYAFVGLAPGGYLLRQTQPSGYASATPDDVPVEVPPDGVAIADFGEQRVAAITGRVIEDRSGDGRGDAGEPGIAGVAVSLYAPGDDGLIGTWDDALVASATTDEMGGYAFGDLPAGRYRVRENDPEGYASVTPNDVLVTLQSGRSASATFADCRVGTVAGAVFDDGNGNGLRDVGEAGLEGVTVRLFAPGADGLLGSADDAVSGVAVTDGDGIYAFSDLTTGAYLVVETDPEGYTSTTANRIAVRVAAAGVAHASFGDTRVLSGDTAGERVAGRVFVDLNGSGTWDTGEQGLVNVTIRLVSPGVDKRFGTGDDVEVAVATTGADGRYAFDAAPGPHLVHKVDPDRYGSTGPTRVAVSVAAGMSALVDMGVQASGTLSGVAFDDLNGNGRQERGEPGVGGATVRVYDAEEGTEDPVATATSAANGTFIVAGLSPGRYTVIQTPPEGYINSDDGRVAITLASGGAATARFANLIVGSVSGTVYNDLNGDGQQDGDEPGLGGVAMQLVESNLSGPEQSRVDGIVAEATTTADGRYRFLGVGVGSYVVRHAPVAGFCTTSAPIADVTITSGSAGTASFGQQPIGSIAGAVFDDADGNGRRDPGERGIGGVSIALASLGADGVSGSDDDAVLAETVTAANGAYAFTGLAGGGYLVRETDPQGYGSSSPNTVEVRLIDGGAAVVHFADRSGLREADEPTVLHLPLAFRGTAEAPDLLIASINVGEDGVAVVVLNQGNAPATAAFWVDLYVEPRTVPSATNQPWHDHADWGMVWGVTGDVLPLGAGAMLTLRDGDALFFAEYSRMPERLAAGTRLYAQVDSVAPGSGYGTVLEGHEVDGDAYNNVAGPSVVSQDTAVRVPSAHAAGPMMSGRPEVQPRSEVER